MMHMSVLLNSAFAFCMRASFTALIAVRGSCGSLGCTEQKWFISVKLTPYLSIRFMGPQNDSSSSYCASLILEVTKNPDKHLKASLASVEVNVYDYWKTLGKTGIHRRLARHKPLLTKENTKAGLTFAKTILILKSPRTFGIIFCNISML